MPGFPKTRRVAVLRLLGLALLGLSFGTCASSPGRGGDGREGEPGYAQGRSRPPQHDSERLPERKDRDGDGVADDEDACPYAAEDLDGFEDIDGCPDPDNDADAIIDVDDRCPNEAEDRDGFDDEDGCPDPDNDADGVLDVDDKCPMLPGPDQGCGVVEGCPDDCWRPVQIAE